MNPPPLVEFMINPHVCRQNQYFAPHNKQANCESQYGLTRRICSPNRCGCEVRMDLGESRICRELSGLPDASVSTPPSSPEERVVMPTVTVIPLERATLTEGVAPARMGGID